MICNDFELKHVNITNIEAKNIIRMDLKKEPQVGIQFSIKNKDLNNLLFKFEEVNIYDLKFPNNTRNINGLFNAYCGI